VQGNNLGQASLKSRKMTYHAVTKISEKDKMDPVETIDAIFEQLGDDISAVNFQHKMEFAKTAVLCVLLCVNVPPQHFVEDDYPENIELN